MSSFSDEKKIIIYDKKQSKLRVKRDLSLTPDSSIPPHFRERSYYIFFNFFSMLFYHKKFGGALLNGIDTIQLLVRGVATLAAIITQQRQTTQLAVNAIKHACIKELFSVIIFCNFNSHVIIELIIVPKLPMH